ncbi:MAG TPA: UDP-N-acetylglucosamine 4,6-dehydratase (inverting) [Patescibacteria group bacterium]
MAKNQMNFKDKTILLTGGTGSFGRAFIKIMLEKHKPKTIRIFSRDEFKQHQLQQEYGYDHPKLRYFIGDVRDSQRVERAMSGVDIVIHAAALKHITAAEYNPFEAVKTNIIGAQNIIEHAINHKVKKVVTISTDKAVNPINLYGGTKMVAEKLFIQGNSYAGNKKTRFSCVRYGNVIASRGSVIPMFIDKAKDGIVPITDIRMTRFWISLEEGIQLVLTTLDKMLGGEIFVPKVPSMKIVDLAKVIAPNAKVKIVGIRPGEKVHEVLISENEAKRTREFKKFFVIEPEFVWWKSKKWRSGNKLGENFRYSSDSNKIWLTTKKVQEIVDQFKKENNLTNSSPISKNGQNKSKLHKQQTFSHYVKKS